MARTKTKKATEDRFNELHNIVTEELIQRVKKGEECTTADLKAAIDWLAKNNISGVAMEDSHLASLKSLIPVIDPESVQRRINGTSPLIEAR